MEQREYLFLRHAEISCTTGTVDEQTNASTISPCALLTTSTTSLMEPPVVTISSTMRTFSPGSIWKPRRRVIFPFSRSVEDGTNTQKALVT